MTPPYDNSSEEGEEEDATDSLVSLPPLLKSGADTDNFNAGMISSPIPLDRIKADDVQHSFAGHTFHDGESCIHTLMLQLTD